MPSALSDVEHTAVAILPGMVRISVGLEAVGDVIADIELALKKSA